MPFLMMVAAPSQGRRVELTFTATVQPYTRREELLFWALVTPPRTERLELPFAAQVRAAGQRQEIAFTALVQAERPLGTPVVHPGQAGSQVTLSCFLGAASGGEYTWDETSETAQLTYDQALDVDQLPEYVTVSIVGAFSRRLRLDKLQSEVEEGFAGGRTTLRLYNEDMEALGNANTPEYIPWRIPGRVPPPQGNTPRPGMKYPVAAAVRQVFAHAGLSFEVEASDPLSGAQWQEGVRDYSTAGVSPRAAFDATYGLLGYRLRLRDARATAYLPANGVGGARLSCQRRGDWRRWRARGHVPARLELKGPDIPRTWRPPLVDFATAPQEESKWLIQTDGQTTTRTRTRTRGNLLLSEDSVTTGRVEIIRVLEDGTSYLDVRSNVLLTATLSVNTYHPEFLEMLLRSETTKYTVGYHSQVSIGDVSVAGLDLQAGDIIPTDTSLTLRRWYTYDDLNTTADLAGFLKSSYTLERKLKSFQQLQAGAADAGPLEAGEYSSQSKGEEYFSKDGVQWTRTAIMDGGGNLAVMDKESGEASHLAERTGNQLHEVETGVTPPRIELKPATEGKTLRDVQIPQPLRYAATLSAEGFSGRGTERREVPWAQTVGELAGYAATLARALGPLEHFSQEMVGGTALTLGDRFTVGGGSYTVTKIQLTAGDSARMTIEGLRLASALSAAQVPPSEQEMQGIYLGRSKDGLTVKVPKGEEDWQDVVVAHRGRVPRVYSAVTIGFSADGYSYIKEA